MCVTEVVDFMSFLLAAWKPVFSFYPSEKDVELSATPGPDLPRYAMLLASIIIEWDSEPLR